MQGELKLFPEPMRSIAAGLIDDTYRTVGSAFQHPIYWIHLYNGTDQAVTFSWDGTDDHLFLPAGGFLVMDITTNHAQNAAGLFFSIGQRIWVREATVTPTTGIITLSAFYAV
jgi:hypothetical protein